MDTKEMNFDTLAYMQTLRHYDFSDHQAEGSALALQHALYGSVASTQALEQFRQSVDGQFHRLEGKISGLDGRMNGLDGRMNGLDGRMDGLDEHIAGLGDRLEGRVEGLHGDIAGVEGRLYVRCVTALGVAATLVTGILSAVVVFAG
jgi:hypothetical protein